MGHTGIIKKNEDGKDVHSKYHGLEPLFEKMPENPMKMLDLRNKQIYTIKKYLLNTIIDSKKDNLKGKVIITDRLNTLFEAVSKTDNWWLLPEASNSFKTLFRMYGNEDDVKEMITDYFKKGYIDEKTKDMLMNKLFK